MKIFEHNAKPVQPRITIITVVRNDADRLLRTILSIARHRSQCVEYIIIDGASTDATLDVIKDPASGVDAWYSEADDGIYDAMNKGIAKANGEYLMFLNAGDELLVDMSDVFSGVTGKPVIIYGRANMFGPDGVLRYIKGKRLKGVGRFLKGMPLCHQAILYQRENMINYDLRFRVMSDRVLTYQLLKKYGLKKTSYVDKVLVNYYEGGFSGTFTHNDLREEEALFYRSVGRHYYIVIKQINALFKFKIKQPILRLFRRTKS